MSYKEIPALLTSCKNIAKAYHCSVNFSRAIHEAQVRVIFITRLSLRSFRGILFRFKIALNRRDHGLYCKRFLLAGTCNFFACGAVSNQKVPSGGSDGGLAKDHTFYGFFFGNLP